MSNRVSIKISSNQKSCNILSSYENAQKKFTENNCGSSAIESSIMVAAISIAIFFALTNFSETFHSVFDQLVSTFGINEIEVKPKD